MQWWSSECYICFRDFNSDKVPRLLPFSCKHDICESCFNQIFKYDNLQDRCAVCHAEELVDSTYRRRAYSGDGVLSVLKEDVFQQILLHKEFPVKLGKFTSNETSLKQKILNFINKK